MQQRDMLWDVYRNRSGEEKIVAREMTLAEAEAFCDAHNAHEAEEGYHYPLPTGFDENPHDLDALVEALA